MISALPITLVLSLLAVSVSRLSKDQIGRSTDDRGRIVLNAPPELSNVFFANHTTMHDLFRIQKYLSLGTNSSCDERFFPSAMKATLLRPPYPNVPVDNQTGAYFPVLMQRLCMETVSLGNSLSFYLDGIICSMISGAHFVGIRTFLLNVDSVNGGVVPDLFARHLPELYLNPSADPKNVLENVKRDCPCDANNCHELPGSPVYVHWEKTAELLRPALEAQFSAVLSTHGPYTDISHADMSHIPDAYKERKGDTAVKHLPFIPEIAIHYRCGDNKGQGFGAKASFRQGYGVLPFRAFTQRIPQDGNESKHIYILSDHMARFSPPPGTVHFCQTILKELFHTMVKHYPNSAILLLRGHNVYLDWMRLYKANITICSASTFCIWPALARNESLVYFPRTTLIAGGTMPKFGSGFTWFSDPPQSNFFRQDTNTFVDLMKKGV